LSGLWIKAISIFGLGIADFGLREGGAAEAAHFLWGVPPAGVLMDGRDNFKF